MLIPDTQVRAGQRVDHLRWAGQYVVDHFLKKRRSARIIQIGDHWDMQSLSSYDKKGGRLFEGRRVSRDIEAGNDAWEAFDEPIQEWKRAGGRGVAKFYDTLGWEFLFGNHEDRITRAINADASIDGLLSLDHLVTPERFRRHDFLKPITFDGIVYAHYFYNPMTGRPYAGENLKLRLKNLGHSFTMGHVQTLDTAIRFVNGQQQRALVAGAYYVHDEEYKGPQGNAHWRGLLVKHGVDGKGGYDLMEVSLGYLCERYEGVKLYKYKTRHYT